MTDYRTVDTPMEKNLSLIKAEYCISAPYQQLIGSLMHVPLMTRPDISYSVSYLSQFNNCYDNSHWEYAKRLLKYLKKTRDFGLKFQKGSEFLQGFVDADWGSNKSECHIQVFVLLFPTH